MWGSVECRSVPVFCLAVLYEYSYGTLHTLEFPVILVFVCTFPICPYKIWNESRNVLNTK